MTLTQKLNTYNKKSLLFILTTLINEYPQIKFQIIELIHAIDCDNGRK